jgi:hypothetical protein
VAISESVVELRRCAVHHDLLDAAGVMGGGRNTREGSGSGNARQRENLAAGSRPHKNGPAKGHDPRVTCRT